MRNSCYYVCVTPQWIVDTYLQRNWVEVFYREAKGWLGLKEYQVRDQRNLLRQRRACSLECVVSPPE
jgi:hypothetical protein